MNGKNPVLAGLALLFGLSAVGRGQDPSQLLEKRTFKGADGGTLPYRLLKPDGYDPQKRYPLVLFLHGAGERGDDNTAQLKHGVAEFTREDVRRKYPCFLAAPQCPRRSSWAPISRLGDPHAYHQADRPSEPLRLALELVESVQKEFSVDEQRLYITGLSMGGFGTWDAITRHPDRFAAAVPVCGGGDLDRADRIARLPIWVFHGAKGPVVKPAYSLGMVTALMKAGGAPGFTQYPEVAHDSWVPAYREPRRYEWLFAQRRK
jgi:predicted peptidase